MEKQQHTEMIYVKVMKLVYNAVLNDLIIKVKRFEEPIIKHDLEILCEVEFIKLTKEGMINFIKKVEKNEIFSVKFDKGNWEERQLYNRMKKNKVLPTNKHNTLSLRKLQKYTDNMLMDICYDLVVGDSFLVQHFE
jgi:hypothetical protein